MFKTHFITALILFMAVACGQGTISQLQEDGDKEVLYFKLNPVGQTELNIEMSADQGLKVTAIIMCLGSPEECQQDLAAETKSLTHIQLDKIRSTADRDIFGVSVPDTSEDPSYKIFAMAVDKDSKVVKSRFFELTR